MIGEYNEFDVYVEVPNRASEEERNILTQQCLRKLGDAMAQHLMERKGKPVVMRLETPTGIRSFERDTETLRFRVDLSYPNLNPPRTAMVPQTRRLTWRERLRGEVQIMEPRVVSAECLE